MVLKSDTRRGIGWMGPPPRSLITLGQAERIIESARVRLKRGSPAELAAELNVHIELFLAMRRLQERSSPSQLAKEFRAVQAAAGRLLWSLGLRDGWGPDSKPKWDILWELRHAAVAQEKAAGGRGRAKLDSAISGVCFIESLAAIAAHRRRQQVDSDVRAGRKRHRGDEAMRAVLAELAHIWFHMFGRDPKSSVGAPVGENKGEVGGPFIRFVVACLAELRSSLTTADLAADLTLAADLGTIGYRTLLADLTLSADAIRKRLRDAGILGGLHRVADELRQNQS